MRFSWPQVTEGSAIAAVAVLVGEHFIDHGKDLNGVHHWLSEYVLSDSPAGQWLMRTAFLILAVAAVALAMTLRERIPKLLFGVAAIGLGTMFFFDTDPNDGRNLAMSWPLTHGNVHQLLLYLAIGGALLGMAISARNNRLVRRPAKLELALSSTAFGATAIQLVLVTVAQSRHQMTHFAGITERFIVLAILAWAVCASKRRDLPTSF